MQHYTLPEHVYQAIERASEQSDLAAWRAQNEYRQLVEEQYPETEDDSEQ